MSSIAKSRAVCSALKGNYFAQKARSRPWRVFCRCWDFILWTSKNQQSCKHKQICILRTQVASKLRFKEAGSTFIAVNYIKMQSICINKISIIVITSSSSSFCKIFIVLLVVMSQRTLSDYKVPKSDGPENI